MARRRDRKDPKTTALREDGTLNPSPEKVSDPKFQAGDFFDPRDMVQVRYEMLRRVSVDHLSVMQVSAEYGVSRPTYYQAKASLDEAGLAGLVPKKRGPHGPNKLRGDLLAFVEKQIVPGKPLRARELARQIRQEFSIEVHPRTIERALGAKKRSTADAGASVEETAAGVRVTEQYEAMRTAALGERLPLEARSGLALLLRRGMWAWAQAAAAPRTTPHPARSSPPASTADDDQRAVVHLFAAMAMRSTDRGPRTEDP